MKECERNNLTKFVLLMVFCILWSADTLFTVIFVGRYGVEMEANPLMKWVMVEFGVLSFTLLKLFIMYAWSWIYMYARVLYHWIIIIPTGIAAVLGGLIVFNG